MPTLPEPDLEQYLRPYVIDPFAVSRDETRLVYSSNMAGQYDLWGVDLAAAEAAGGLAGGATVHASAPYQLTFRGQACQGIEFHPSGEYLFAMFDHDGDELSQIFALRSEGGAPLPFVTCEGQRNFIAHVSEDGRFLYYVTSRDNPQFLNSWRRDLESGDETQLLQGERGASFITAVSPDGTSFVWQRLVANTHLQSYLRRNGADAPLIPDPETPSRTTNAVFLDDDTVIFSTTHESDFAYLARYRASTGEFTPIHPFESEEVVNVKLHRASRRLFVVTAAGVDDHLWEVTLSPAGDLVGEPRAIDLPVANVDQVEVGESGTLYLAGRSATVPMNVYVRAPGGRWSRITENRVPGVPAERLVEPEVVHYDSFDGTRIEALLFHPRPDVANGHTIVWPHGGPQAAERRFYRGSFQFLVNRGYAIFCPNFRGSYGYGAKFFAAVERDWGGGARLDMVAGIEWLLSQGLADRDRLFVMGGSFGGYMTLLLYGRHGEYFRAAVDIFGPSNLFSFVQSVPDFWKPMMDAWVGNPERDREKMTEDSPITYLDRMTKPILVIQGANDPRVVKAESDQIVAALREKGVEVEYIVFDNEGHGFAHKENEIRAYTAALEFLDAHRADAGASEAAAGG